MRAAAAAVLALALAACATAPLQDMARDEAAVRAELARVQSAFNAGEFDAFMSVFADDAVIVAQGQADVVGVEAIRALYEETLAQVDMTTEFTTEEVAVSGDLAFERGSYVIYVRDKASGDLLDTVRNRHVHIFRRDADGRWRTWRLIASGAE
jgi:uncharacterized protein (TIGR02246 family)